MTVELLDIVIFGLMATVITVFTTGILEYILIKESGPEKFLLGFLKLGAIIFWPLFFILLFL